MGKFGKTELSTKLINFYSLDFVLTVGYRIDTKREIQFRKWTNNVLIAIGL